MFVLETKRSFCRICIASCGTLVTIDGDTVLHVHGDPDHPLSQGYLCPKGRALGAMHHDPARLSGSFVRREGMLAATDHRVTVEAPDTDRLRSALGTLDALIVLDILANETTAHATHLFSCHDQLERADVLAMDLYAPARYSHYTDAVVAPAEGRHAAWRVLAEIAAGVGVEVIGKGVDLDSVTTDEVLARVARGADIGALWALEGAPIMAEKAVYDWVQQRLPNRLWDLAPASLVVQLAAQIETDTATTGPGLVLIPRRQLRRENAHAYRSGETADVWIHPRDAYVRSVIEGARVEVRSSVGRVFVTARVTDAITPGCVSLPHGYAEPTSIG